MPIRMGSGISKAGARRKLWAARPALPAARRSEFSDDHGLTWQPSFDFVYRPHDAAGD